ncbi:MAG TPA: phage portal protein [Candidatus Kapabacteria bacterium]|nr:phage portal protein [Candidatus Kapabacteria bacterium]
MGIVAESWARVARFFGGESQAVTEPGNDDVGYSMKSCGPGVVVFSPSELDRFGPGTEFPRLFTSRMDPDGVLANSIVMACVSALTFATQEMRLRVRDTRRARPIDHPLDAVFRQPTLGFDRLFGRPGRWVEMSAGDMLVRIMTYASIGGVAYVEKIVAGRRLMGFQVHHRFAVDRDVMTGQIYGVQRPDGSWDPVEHRDMIPLKWPVAHPEDEHIGLAPVEALLREIGMDRYATEFTHSLLRDDGIPFQGLKLPPGSTLDEQKRKNVKEEFARRAGRKGELAILENGAEFTRPGLTISELDLENVYRIPESRIPACFRVPAPVAGMAMGVENSDYNNFAEAREAFAEGTIVPLAANWGSAIDKGLREEGWVRNGHEVMIDCSGMVALEEVRRKRDAMVRADYEASVITLQNER